MTHVDTPWINELQPEVLNKEATFNKQKHFLCLSRLFMNDLVTSPDVANATDVGCRIL